MTRLERFTSAFRRALPTLTSTLAGTAAGVVLVISCNMGPSISMADGTTGGDTSGGSTGGSAGGGTSGGSTGGGSGGSCSCSLSGPITLAGPISVAGPITNTPASENSAQLVSGQLPFLSSLPAGAFDCTSIAQNGAVALQGGHASCIKLADGPFVFTDLTSIPNSNNFYGAGVETWIFAAPPSANWDASTQAQWFVAQIQLTSNSSPQTTNTGMHYAVPAGSSLYAVSGYGATGLQPALSFSWAGFKPYQ